MDSSSSFTTRSAEAAVSMRTGSSDSVGNSAPIKNAEAASAGVRFSAIDAAASSAFATVAVRASVLLAAAA